MTLRARLVLGLLTLSGVGLMLLGGITYAVQRHFLEERVNRQAVAALDVVDREFARQGIGAADLGQGGGGHDGRPVAGSGKGGVALTPGVYAQRRGPGGRVLGEALYEGAGAVRPRLPAELPPGRLLTVGAVDADLRYRVATRANFAGGIDVAAVPLRELEATLDQLLLVEGLVIGGVLIALAVLSSFLVTLGLRPLERIADTAGAIAAGDLSRRMSSATPRTEVGRLGLALNAMLARLESAFSEREASERRLRQFIADASHELRTPLASIRGYAELFRLGAAGDPRDTAKAMRRIEDEAKRMGVLVEDLLTLARLDEVRSAAHAPVDVAALGADAVADARATAPDRAITLRASAETVVAGDRDQLRQVLANLLRNALTHTPPGTGIEVSVERDAGWVVITVRDHGPGLPTQDAGVLFERFWRADPGRERGPGGAGLGLAIVAGIVRAHHGSVAAADAVDGGAQFTVRLPGVEALPAP